jgi:hypothetical protein
MSLNKLAPSLALAAAMIGAALAIVYASKAHLIDGDAGTRTVMAIIGLALVHQANAIPKAVLRSERARSMRRLSGYAFFLSGLAYAAIWAFAPIGVAADASMIAVGAAMILVIGACLLSRTGTPTPQ